MAQAVRELYHAGEEREAQRILDELDKLCGRGGLIPNNKYVAPVDVFVRKVRHKLEKASPDWKYIHTHFGVGYRFAAELREGAVEIPDVPPADLAPAPKPKKRAKSKSS